MGAFFAPERNPVKYRPFIITTLAILVFWIGLIAHYEVFTR